MSIGRYGNENLAGVVACQYITTGAASDSTTLQSNIQGITLYSTEDAWVNIGTGTVTAAAPSGEKVSGESFFLPSQVFVDVPVPSTTDEKPCVVAAIQDSASGNVYLYSRII